MIDKDVPVSKERAQMNLRIYGNDSSKEQFVSKPVRMSSVDNPLETLTLKDFSPSSSPSAPIQRIFDIILAITALLLLLPVFVVIALIIRLDSEGPVLFKQRRVGLDGTEFWFYKFRSMVADAESKRQDLILLNEASGPIFKIKKDPRITRSGGLLRKYSLDELPQLINVITGDMSLVGPRPALPNEVVKYTDRQRRRLSIRPGITGLWQVSGRSDLPFDRSVELDLEYIDRQSIWLYIKILCMTLPAVTSGKGAY